VASAFADPSKVTAEAILAKLPSPLPTGIEIKVVSGALVCTSAKKGVGSKVALNAPKAVLTKGWKKTYAGATDSTSTENEVKPLALVVDKSLEHDEVRGARAAATQLKTWWGNLQKLPADMKNQVRPLVAAVGSVNKLVSDCEKVVSFF